jgi:hypothetical protein
MTYPGARLFPECAVPGCRNPVEAIGHPCADCLEAFGPRLRPGRPLTEEQITERDTGIKAAYAAMRALRIADGMEAKRNQMCWLCEQRRTCTKQERGWECDACRRLT